MKALLVIHLRTAGVVQACQHFYHFEVLLITKTKKKNNNRDGYGHYQI